MRSLRRLAYPTQQAPHSGRSWGNGGGIGSPHSQALEALKRDEAWKHPLLCGKGVEDGSSSSKLEARSSNLDASFPTYDTLLSLTLVKRL